jgi:homocysteine S-methyltransferase
MKKGTFLSALRSGALVFDGAMGTALYERGLLYSTSLDHACISKPDVVREIHRAYVEAGADVLTTNTFGAGRFRLEPHGLEGQVREINLAGVALAREEAGDKTWVLGSVGPTGLMLKTVKESRYPELQAAFREQAAALAEAGVDAIVLETFRQPEELELAMAGVKAGTRGGLPILACASFDAFGTMSDGSGPEKVGRRMVEWGADAIGVNCSDGPAGVYEMSTRMLEAGVPVVAVPNAGLPHRVEGRLAYRATPEYFQLYARRLYKAGVHGVGGCCGTTAEHIRKIAAASRMVGGGEAVGRGGGMRDERISQVPGPAPGIEVVPTHEKGRLGGALGQRFVVSVEVNPPPGLSLEKALAGARLLKEGGVDVINIADGPRASARMGNLALSVRVQDELDMPALMHVTTRDRNLLGLLAHLLAAHELGVKNLCVITGDPPKMGAFPDATPVYDTDSVGLLRLIRGLNHGYDPGGKPMGEATSFFSATGAEPAAQDLDRELDRLALKVEAGAEMVMTQPVYDPEVLHRFLERTQDLQVPTLVGILPLASYRNAEFLHNEVPGMNIPEGIRERMRAVGGGDAGRAEGVLIAREMLETVRDRVAGAYIMPPFARYALALDVIDGIVR